MKWKKLTVKTITDAEDIIISELYDIGLEGAIIEDNVPLTAWEKEQMFVDILPDAPEDDGTAWLSFFVEVPSDEDKTADKSSAAKAWDEPDAKEKNMLQKGIGKDTDNSYYMVSDKKTVDMDALVDAVKEKLDEIRRYMDIGEGSIVISETEDKDWLNNWKEYFHQFYIDDLLITPSWEEIKPEDADKKVLHIDPGTAFGTGMHETTQLCIRQLKKHITPQTRLLDIGTGSGILAIVSLMYGIECAVGTDLDSCAIEAVRENMEANGIDNSKFTMMIGNIISDKEIQENVGYEAYDIVAANILAEVLVPLIPVAAKCLKKGGILITSGILIEKERLVTDAVRDADMEVIEVTRQNEWISVTALK